MAAAPRKNKFTNIPNLYGKFDKRTEKVYYSYKDLRTGKSHGLGSDRQIAEKQARQLNMIIGQEMIDKAAAAIITKDGSHGITVETCIEGYLERQMELVNRGKIKQNTYNAKKWAMNPVLEKCGKLKLSQFTTLAINKILKSYRDQGKETMAQRVRSILIDMFKDAIEQGHFPADKPNPAFVTRSINPDIKRARLTGEVFNRALKWSKENQAHYCHKAFLLALVTGQALSEIDAARFKDIVKHEGAEYLKVIRGKTGAKLLIPLDLKLDLIDMSVRDVINVCRDNVLSKHLLHHRKQVGQALPGNKIRKKTLSNKFAEAIAALEIDWGDNTPPSFHELRSLSEREYEKQGIDTQKLLAHKHRKTTDTYHDARGHDWIVVNLN